VGGLQVAEILMVSWLCPLQESTLFCEGSVDGTTMHNVVMHSKPLWPKDRNEKKHFASLDGLI